MSVRLHNMSGAVSASSVTTAGAVTAGSLTVAGNSITANGTTTPADRGYLAWSFQQVSGSGGTALTPAGTLHLTRIYRVPAGPVTNIVIALSAGGSSLTSGQCFAALFTAAGAHVGTTADQAAAWATAGVKVMPLASGPFPVSAGDFYVGFWYNGTTGPSVIRGGSVSAAFSNAGLSAPNLAHCTADTGLSTTAPSSLGAQTASALQWWAALS